MQRGKQTLLGDAEAHRGLQGDVGAAYAAQRLCWAREADIVAKRAALGFQWARKGSYQ